MDSNSNSEEGTRKKSLEIDRRRILALSGATAAGALAGCVGGDDEGNGNGEDPLVSTEFVTSYLGTEQDLQFNRHNVTITPKQFVTRPLFVDLITHSRQTGEFYPIGLRDYSIGEDEVRTEVYEGLTWHNGDDVTGEDLARVFKLNYYMNLTWHNYVESAEDIYADGDYEAVIELNGTYNPVAIETSLAEDLLDAPEAVFGEYIEAFQDATSDDELDSVRGELSEFAWREPEPHANGPFELDSIDSQGMRTTKYADYPWAEIQENLQENFDVDLSDYPDELNIENWTRRFFSERPSLAQAAMTGDIDGGQGIEIDSYDQLENEYPDYANYIPLTSGWNDCFVYNVVNGEHADMWRDERVRKAFLHILDFEGINQQYSGDWGFYDNRPDGMTPPMEQTLDDEFFDNLQVFEQDHDRAAELLEDAGLTREGGEWYKPNGERFVAPWKAPSTVQWQIDGMEYAASNLTEFGIESNVEVIEGTSYFGQTLPNLDYELARGLLGHFNIIDGWEITWIRYDGANEEDEPFANYLQEPYGEPGLEVPPVGEPDSDDTIEIDPVALYEELRSATEEDRINEIQRQLAWAFNQTVPKIPGSAGAYAWYMTERWNYPDHEEDHPFGLLQPFTPTLPQVGAISAKRESEYDY